MDSQPPTTAANSTILPISSSQFTIFKKLPPEVRLRVWRHSFPRRRVRVLLSIDHDIVDDHIGMCGEQFCEITNADVIECPDRRHGRNKLPVTMHVNYESRQETLRRYKVLFPGLTIQPIMFHPALDVVYFVGFYTTVDMIEFIQLTAVACIAKRTKSNIELIQNLELRSVCWERDTQEYLEGRFDNILNEFQYESQHHLPPRFDINPTVGGLRSFHGLKEVILNAGKGNSGLVDTKLDTPEKERALYDAMVKYFEREKKMVPRMEIPAITMRENPYLEGQGYFTRYLDLE